MDVMEEDNSFLEEIDYPSEEEYLSNNEEEEIHIPHEENNLADPVQPDAEGFNQNLLEEQEERNDLQNVNGIENVDGNIPLQEQREIRDPIAVGAQGPLFAGLQYDQRMNMFLQGRNDIYAKDHFLIALAQTVAARETYESLINKLVWIKQSYIYCHIPTTMKQLWKTMGRDTSNLIYSLYCSICRNKVGDGKTVTRECHCGSCGPNSSNKHLATYILTPIIPQLQEILKLPNIAETLRYRDERVKINANNIEDIFDGEKYQELRRNGILREPYNMSLTLWIDGVALAKSSKASCCPILLRINELPPYARHKHIILAGVYVGNQKPHMNYMLMPVANELTYLHNTGITWEPYAGVEVTSKFVTTILTADSVARPDVLRMTQYNGYFGCTKCHARGEQLPETRKMVYPDVPRVLRTNESIRNDITLAVTERRVVNGVKGATALAQIPDFDLDSGVVHDDCHNFHLGCARQLTKIFLDDRTGQWYIGSPANLKLIDERLAKIKVPSEMSRRPRSIKDYNNWKATEWRNWLLYYSLPCLDGILKEPYFSHFALLSGAVFILSNASISQNDVLVARAYLDQFSSLAQGHYGLKNMSYNLHFAGHSPKSVVEWGPSWVYSTYPFESFCSKIKDNVTSANSRADQIVTRFFMKKFLQKCVHSNDISERTKNEIKRLLEYNPVNIPEGTQPGHYFNGKGRPNQRQPTVLEINAIRITGETIEEETIVNVYEKAIIHRVDYQIYDNVQRDICNSVVYTRNGFLIIRGFVSYQIGERTVCGIIGTCLEEGNNLYGTRYITEVFLNGEISFVSLHDVIVPGILMNINKKWIAIPMSNTSSID